MNKLSSELRSRIVHLLCEGMSIRAITRTAGVSKLLFDTGLICAEYHDKHGRNVAAKRVQVDEIWSFTYAKQKNVAAPDGADVDYAQLAKIYGASPESAKGR